MRKLLVKFYHLNRMGRIEGPPLAGILLLAGALYSTPNISLVIFLSAFLMAACCMNYVYLVNGITDVKEDSINAPERPLSSGAIGIREAKIYVNMLLMLGIIYPFFISNSWMERSIVWMLLLMGYLYSCPPIRFKRFPPLATIYLVLNFNLPIVLGYWMSSSTNALPPFILSTVMLFLANMPLKDYGDRIGDEKAGVKNWVKLAGSPENLLLFTSILSLAGCMVCYFFLPISLTYRWVFVLLPLMPALNILIHSLFQLNMDKMFTHGVRTLILLISIILVAW